MATLFWIVLILLIVLTGAIVPVLIFAKWSLIVVLVIALVLIVVVGLARIILKPIALLGADISDTVKVSRRPIPGDLDYPAYLDWANRKGEYGLFSTWEEARQHWLTKKKWEAEERETWEREEESWRRFGEGRNSQTET